MRGLGQTYINYGHSKHKTTKFIFQALEHSAKMNSIKLPHTAMDYVFVTMAVLFARKGSGFRGNHNFDENASAKLSRPFLKEQIEIVSPHVIITLGNLATESVLKIFKYEMKENLTKTIKTYSPQNYTFELHHNKVVVIPAYHPASHVSIAAKLSQWHHIWKILKTALDLKYKAESD